MSLCKYVNKSERLTRLRCWCWSWRLGCRKSGSDWVNWGRSITSSLASQRAGEERKRVRPLVKPQTSVCQQHNTIWPSAKTASSSKIIPEFPSEQSELSFFLNFFIKLISGAKGVSCLLVHNSLFLFVFVRRNGLRLAARVLCSSPTDGALDVFIYTLSFPSPFLLYFLTLWFLYCTLKPNKRCFFSNLLPPLPVESGDVRSVTDEGEGEEGSGWHTT